MHAAAPTTNAPIARVAARGGAFAGAGGSLSGSEDIGAANGCESCRRASRSWIRAMEIASDQVRDAVQRALYLLDPARRGRALRHGEGRQSPLTKVASMVKSRFSAPSLVVCRRRRSLTIRTTDRCGRLEWVARALQSPNRDVRVLVTS